MGKMLLVDLSKCTGCETCMDICSGRKAGAYSEKASRIRIFKHEISALFIPLVCEQCREHPCVDICPANAIQFDKNLSIFLIDESTCTGCGSCEGACPYHGIFVSDGIAIKCDLCGGGLPCVAVCYPKALQYVDVTRDNIVSDLKYKTDKLKKIRRYFHG